MFKISSRLSEGLRESGGRFYEIGGGFCKVGRGLGEVVRRFGEVAIAEGRGKETWKNCYKRGRSLESEG